MRVSELLIDSSAFLRKVFARFSPSLQNPDYLHIMILEGVRSMDIEIEPKSKTEEFFEKIREKAESLLFAVVLKIPEQLVPSFVMNWMKRYVEKRKQELQEQLIKQRWEQMKLEKVVAEIRQQDRTKAPQED